MDLATVRAIAEPVCTVIHQMIENCTALELNSENAWPIYIVRMTSAIYQTFS